MHRAGGHRTGGNVVRVLLALYIIVAVVYVRPDGRTQRDIAGRP